MAVANVINGDWRHSLLSILHQLRRLSGGKTRQFNHFVSRKTVKRLKKQENARRHARRKLSKSGWES